MKKEFHPLVFSLSELVICVQSLFVSWMACLYFELPKTKLKNNLDALLNYWRGKGAAHEFDFLDSFEQLISNLVNIPNRLNNIEKMKTTLDGIQSGPDENFQVSLTSNEDDEYQVQRHADFLFKVSNPSSLGDCSPEPWDTKQPKSYFIIQMCCYADLLNQGQDKFPYNIAILLCTQKEVSYRLLDFWQYDLSQKQVLLTQYSNLSKRRAANYWIDNMKNLRGWLLTNISLRFVKAPEFLSVTLQGLIVPL